MHIDRRSFLLGSTAIITFASLPVRAWIHGGGNQQSTGQVALNRAFDLGISNTDNISNYPKPPLVLTVDADIDAGSTITIKDGNSTFLTHSLTAADYNVASFSQTSSAMADGSYAMTATVLDKGVTTNLTGFTYTVNTAISTPSITGSSPANTQTPTYTVTFGTTKPQVGDILVLEAALQSGGGNLAFNAQKTLAAGDLTTTTITAATLALGFWNIAAYVYRTTSFVFSQVSNIFAQTVEPANFITTTISTLQKDTNSAHSVCTFTAPLLNGVCGFTIGWTEATGAVITGVSIVSGAHPGGLACALINSATSLTNGIRNTRLSRYAFNNSGTGDVTCTVTVTLSAAIDALTIEPWQLVGTSTVTPSQSVNGNSANPITGTVNIPSGGSVIVGGVSWNVPVVTWAGITNNPQQLAATGSNSIAHTQYSVNVDSPAGVTGQAWSFALNDGNNHADVVLVDAFGP